MRVRKKTLCSALQLPLTLSMASFLVPPDGPSTSMFPLCPRVVQVDSPSYRDMTHTVDFFKILFYLENTIIWWEIFLTKQLIQDFPRHQ